MQKKDDQKILTEILNHYVGSSLIEFKDGAKQEEMDESRKNLQAWKIAWIIFIVLLVSNLF